MDKQCLKDTQMAKSYRKYSDYTENSHHGKVTKISQGSPSPAQCYFLELMRIQQNDSSHY